MHLFKKQAKIQSSMKNLDEFLKFEHQKIKEFNFVAYFTYFFNVSFALLISPFYIRQVKEEGCDTVYTFKSYWWHKVCNISDLHKYDMYFQNLNYK